MPERGRPEPNIEGLSVLVIRMEEINKQLDRFQPHFTASQTQKRTDLDRGISELVAKFDRHELNPDEYLKQFGTLMAEMEVFFAGVKRGQP